MNLLIELEAVSCHTIDIDQTKFCFGKRGSGPEVIVFLHGLLWSHKMFEQQMDYFADRYTCIGIDLRGQGGSEVTDEGYGIDEQVEDVRLILQRLEISECHVVGLSMGGFIGLRLAAWHPSLVKSLHLIGSSAEAESGWKRWKYRLLAYGLLCFGFKWVQGRVFELLFSPASLSSANLQEERVRWGREFQSNNRKGIFHAVQGVIQRADFTNELGNISCPTHIITGEYDAALPISCAECMHDGIAESVLTILPNVGHSATLEDPAAVNRTLNVLLL